jgi:hypothetical protein
MRRAAVFALSVLLAHGAAAAPPTVFDPARAVVFPPEKAADLTHACSRAGPGPVEGTWMPQPEDIVALEAGLPKVFYNAAKAEGTSLDATRYTRQYGGLIIGGRKIVYVNASMLMTDPALDDPPLVRARMDWREHGQRACDDGDSSFGVEYDVEARTFRNFEFDGCMCVRKQP